MELENITGLLTLRVPKKLSIKKLYNITKNFIQNKMQPSEISRDTKKFIEIIANFISPEDLNGDEKLFATKLVEIFLNNFNLSEALHLIHKNGRSINQNSLIWAYNELGYNISPGLSSLIIKLLRKSGRLLRISYNIPILDSYQTLLNYLSVKGEAKVAEIISKFGDVTQALVELSAKGKISIHYRKSTFKVEDVIENVDDVPENIAKKLDEIFVSEWSDYEGKKHYKIVFPQNAKVRFVYGAK